MESSSNNSESICPRCNNWKENSKKNNFWTGLIAGFVVSILTSVIAIYYQHNNTIEEKRIQLYIDEKKEFTYACYEYLNLYRNWHELVNFFTYYDTCNVVYFAEYENREQAIKTYRQWRKDFDYAYGKILLLSDNEFGPQTMKISTILDGSIKDVIFSNLSKEKKKL